MGVSRTTTDSVTSLSTNRSRLPTVVLLGLFAASLLACSGAVGEAGDGDGDGNGAGGSMGGAGGTGGDGAVATGGLQGMGAGPSGTGGEPPSSDDPDQGAVDAAETCVYGYLTLEIDAEGDTGTEASLVSRIDQSIYDASSGSQFTTEADNGVHLVISWQPPPEKPDFVDFNASLSYTTSGGAGRHLCISGRLLDSYQYPVEPYYTFSASTVFEANADGSCTVTPVVATVSGCLSENYNL